jgi:hypothetical protein
MSHMRNGIAAALLVLTVAACGDVWGFDDLTDTNKGDGGSDGGTTPDGSVPDRGDAPGDASADRGTDSGDSGLVEASTDGTTAEVGPACCEAPTAACSSPLASCPIPSENRNSFPSYFEVYTSPAEYCMVPPVATPTACLCNYTCACITSAYHCSSGTETCTADPIAGVLVTCAN